MFQTILPHTHRYIRLKNRLKMQILKSKTQNGEMDFLGKLCRMPWHSSVSPIPGQKVNISCLLIMFKALKASYQKSHMFGLYRNILLVKREVLVFPVNCLKTDIL